MKLRKLMASTLILSMILIPLNALAKEGGLISGEDVADVLLESRQNDVIVQQVNDGTGIELPESFDLRELGVVTPVKFQNPWGTCWGFAAIAAAETSILSEMGKTYEETGLDLSEHHLTYFSHIPIVDETQNGEGWYVKDISDVLDTGGFLFTASSVFSSGVGVVTEDLIPYRGYESKTENFLFYNFNYSRSDDWTLPEEYRLIQSYELEESNIFDSPAVYSSDMSPNADSFERQQNYLGYDATATENIKKELLAGRAVSICFTADQSQPGVEGPIMYLNTDTWAHFTFNGANPNHAVTIVGYDDNYPASNFLDHSNDPYGDGLPHQPEGDGAWIVKNSWGAMTEEFPNHSDGGWGIPNDDGLNTGYFYLSYYDRSISIPETFDFNVSNEGGNYLIEQYDYLPSDNAEGWMDTNELEMANIFTAEADAFIRNLSCETSAQNTTVKYMVYLMDNDDVVPTDGTLVATLQEEYQYAGYHRINLSEQIPVNEGQRYAVVVSQTVNVDDNIYYCLETNCALNEEGMNAYNYSIYMDNAYLSDEQLQEYLLDMYAVGIVNPGESMIYVGELGGWADWSDVISQFQKTNEYMYTDFDNFPIKAYLDFADADSMAYDPLPELHFAEPAELVNLPYLTIVLLVIIALIIVLLVIIIIIIRHTIRKIKHPELRKPKKPSYKKLKAQLEEANNRIAEIENKNQ